MKKFGFIKKPVNIWAKDSSTSSESALRQHTLYGDSAGLTDPHLLNLNGQLVTHYDEAGKATITGYDFKGNPLEKVRQVIADTELTGTEKYVVDWVGLSVPLETKEYVTGLLYDGLNRVRKSIYPEDVDSERKELVPTYNNAGALESLILDDVQHVKHIAYNAKGQRILLARGNHSSGPEFGMMTRYAYDPVTYRLLRIRTEKFEEDDHTYDPQSGTTRQDSAYEYDLGGNILTIKERVSDCGIAGTTLGTDALDRTFDYDPLKRLLQATGRESDTQSNSNFWEEKPAPGSPNANHTRTYTQSFAYDKVGNILTLGHQATGNGYTRHYRYDSPKNHLLSLDDDGSPATAFASFTYDYNGNQLTINTDRFFEWDAADQLRYFKIDDGTTVSVQAHYLYAGGNRVKKLVRDQQGNTEITVYIDGVYEHCYRKDSGGTVTDEQTLLHVMDGRSRIATVRLGDVMDDPGPAVKYNLEDLLGTSTTRLTNDGTTIDREEYYPFGESSLRTFDKKRYRYVGKELDSESGLYYYGARYYAAWVGRFISIGPLADSYAHLNPYNYAGNKPIGDLDIDGLQSEGEEKTGQSTTHKTAAGDTYSSIAEQYGVTVHQLRDWNGYEDTKIPTGATIVISNPFQSEEYDGGNIQNPTSGPIINDYQRSNQSFGLAPTGLVIAKDATKELAEKAAYRVIQKEVGEEVLEKGLEKALGFTTKGAGLLVSFILSPLEAGKGSYLNPNPFPLQPKVLNSDTDVDEDDDNYEYFYRAMSQEELQLTGGLVVDRNLPGRPPFVTNRLDYLLRPGSFVLDQTEKYDVLVRYKMPLGTYDRLMTNSVDAQTKHWLTRLRISGGGIARKKEGSGYNFAVVGLIGEAIFNSRILGMRIVPLDPYRKN